MAPLVLDVWSDYLCPWCANASHRLHAVVEEFSGRVELRWKSYLLRPYPEPNRDLEKFRAYTEGWRRVAADEDAAPFNVWASDEGPPSHSVPAHLVAKAAAALGPEAFERMHHALLRAYFVQNRDISNPARLREIWLQQGLPLEAFAGASGEALLAEVTAEHNEAISLGVGGVPAVRIGDDDVVITGAHPRELYRRWLSKRLALLEEKPS